MQGESDAMDAQSHHADTVAIEADVYIHVKLHSTLGQGAPHTLPELLDAFQVQVRCASLAVTSIQGRRAVHRESLQVQQVGYDLAILAPSKWRSVVCVPLCQEGTVALQLFGVGVHFFCLCPRMVFPSARTFDSFWVSSLSSLRGVMSRLVLQRDCLFGQVGQVLQGSVDHA